MKTWVVQFDTEAGDHYVACFNQEPTDAHLLAYCLENYGYEFRLRDDSDISKGGERLITWEISEEEIQDLPLPLDKKTARKFRQI